ncbi:MAG: CHASE2 domain-containing protein [Vicinamibacterales bacterium]
MSRRTLAGLLIGFVAAALVLALDAGLSALVGPAVPHALDLLELKTYDWRLRQSARPETARSDIALVEIDEYSLQNLEPVAGRWPWPRIVHASLIDYLARGGARVIAYDITFGARDTRLGFAMGADTLSGAESDQAFADAVRRAGNVVVLVDATFDGEKTGAPAVADSGLRIGSERLLERRSLLPPYPELLAAAAGVGHNYLALDADGPVRHTVPFVRSGDLTIASLGMAAAMKGGGIDPARVAVRDDVLQVGDARLPLSVVHTQSGDGAEAFYWRPINFRGPPLLDDLKRRPYASYAFYDLLYSEEQLLAGETPKVDPATFKDKIVFVGVTASGLFDVFETPFSRGRMPGIQVHAAVADDVLSNRPLAAAPGSARAALVVSAALVVGVLGALVPVWWAACGSAVLIAALTLAVTRAFAGGLWINVTQPVLAAVVALFGTAGYQYFVEGRERRKIAGLFGRYVSKDVYEQLVADPSLARLGGQRREMTVLFSDIRGFTSVTEQGEPEAIVGTLNEYFSRMVDLVFLHRGTLDKFVGDMVMALFGAPLDDPDHADHAVRAALDMVRELRVLNERWAGEGRPTLDIGIGINTGPMIAGNIGSEAIMSYTVIGDAVNLGSRLESLNKQYGTHIIISDSTRQRLKGNYALRPLGEVVVKGKSRAVSIFEVLGRAADGPPADVPAAVRGGVTP